MTAKYLNLQRYFQHFIMSPATPKAKVSKTKANTKMPASNDEFDLKQKLYFLWVHLQMKEGGKLNHAAVARKLNLNYKTAFGRWGQVKKLMENFEKTMAAQSEEDEVDSKDSPVNLALDKLDKTFSEGEVLR
ncbi:hypothetical protein F1880_002877 [Penicillium rolfsii]|nr:hypothetical protein F1880_002877 [Penicillium rolfsii]